MRRGAVLLASALVTTAAVTPEPTAAAAPLRPLVAYSCDSAGTYDIYLASIDGSGAKRVTDTAAAETSPAWSPDGSRLVFWSTLAGTSQLAVVSLSDGTRRDLTVNVQPDSPHRLFAPAWSPDGRSIVFESNRDAAPGAVQTDLYLVAPDGTGLRRLTHDAALTAAPAWVDSRSLVLSRQFGTGDGTPYPELFVRRIDGGEVRLTHDDWHDWDAAPAPRGRSVAFMSNRPDGRTFRIHLRAASGRSTAVTAGPDGSFASSPSWTPDGRSLAYAYDVDGPVDPSVGYFGGTDVRIHAGGPANSRIQVVRPDGAGDRAITDGSSSCITPAVRPR